MTKPLNYGIIKALKKGDELMWNDFKNWLICKLVRKTFINVPTFYLMAETLKTQCSQQEYGFYHNEIK